MFSFRLKKPGNLLSLFPWKRDDRTLGGRGLTHLPHHYAGKTYDTLTRQATRICTNEWQFGRVLID